MGGLLTEMVACGCLLRRRPDDGQGVRVMTEAQWQVCTDPQNMLSYLRGEMASQDVTLASGTVVQVPVYPECKASNRKLGLFGCACCRRIWHLLSDPRSRQAIEVAECFMDGVATQDECGHAGKVAEDVAESQYSTVHDAAERVAASFDPDDPDTQFWVHGAHECASSASAAARAASYAADLSCPPTSVIDAAGKATYALAHSVSPLLFTEECNPDLTLRNRVTEAEKTVQAALLRDIFGNPFRPVAIEPVWLTPSVTNLATTAYDERRLPSGELDAARLAVLADALEEAGCDNPDILNHCRQPRDHVRGCWVLDLLLGKE